MHVYMRTYMRYIRALHTCVTYMHTYMHTYPKKKIEPLDAALTNGASVPLQKNKIVLLPSTQRLASPSTCTCTCAWQPCLTAAPIRECPFLTSIKRKHLWESLEKENGCAVALKTKYKCPCMLLCSGSFLCTYACQVVLRTSLVLRTSKVY